MELHEELHGSSGVALMLMRGRKQADYHSMRGLECTRHCMLSMLLLRC